MDIITKSNSEAAGPTDSDNFISDSVTQCLSAFIARGSIKKNISTLEFKYNNETDLLYDVRSKLIDELHDIFNRDDIPVTFKANKYIIHRDIKSIKDTSMNADKYLWSVFKYWSITNGYLPISLINNKMLFLSTYMILRGSSFEKNRDGSKMRVTRIFGNRNTLIAINDMIYEFNYNRINNGLPYIPRIHQGSKKDSYIEIGPDLTDTILNTVK